MSVSPSGSAAHVSAPSGCSRGSQHSALQKKRTDAKKEEAATTALSSDIEVAPSWPIRWKYAQPWQKSTRVLPPYDTPIVRGVPACARTDATTSDSHRGATRTSECAPTTDEPSSPISPQSCAGSSLSVCFTSVISCSTYTSAWSAVPPTTAARPTPKPSPWRTCSAPTATTARPAVTRRSAPVCSIVIRRCSSMYAKSAVQIGPEA